MARVLVVDDDDGLRDTMCQILKKEGHHCVSAGDAPAALEAAASQDLDVVVTDIVMPGRDGIELLREMREVAPRACVIVVTGAPSVGTAAEALRAGAYDYLPKPVQRLSLCTAVAGAARLKRSEDEALEYRERLEQLVVQRTQSLNDALQRMQRTLDGTIMALSRAMETRDPYTAGHQRRVASLACAVGERLDIPDAILWGLRTAALLHDIGKLSVPAEVLAKPTRLSKAEFALVQCHAEAGARILDRIEFGAPIADIVRQHHERMDGSGYPEGLAGARILLEARILAVADVVEAMMSHRPYRPALGLDAALAELARGSGSVYDAGVVEACVDVCRDERFSLEPG